MAWSGTGGPARAVPGLAALDSLDINLAEGLASSPCLGEVPMGQLGAAALNQFAAKAGGLDPQWQTLRAAGSPGALGEAGHGLDPHAPSPFGVAGLGLHASRRTWCGMQTRQAPAKLGEGLPNGSMIPCWACRKDSMRPMAWPHGTASCALPVRSRGVHELCDGIVLGRIQWEDWLRTAPTSLGPGAGHG